MVGVYWIKYIVKINSTCLNFFMWLLENFKLHLRQCYISHGQHCCKDLHPQTHYLSTGLEYL